MTQSNEPTKSNTPRTDAHIEATRGHCMSVSAIFARQLETELAQAKKQLAQVREQVRIADLAYCKQAKLLRECLAENQSITTRIADLEKVAGELAECLKLFQAGQTFATQNRYVPAAIRYEKAESMIDKALQSFTGLQKKGDK